MTASSRQARLNESILSRAAGFGEVMTFTRAGASTGVPVTAAITRRSDLLWSGGMIGVTEDHYKGYVVTSLFKGPPAIGDTFTKLNGETYEVDQNAIESFGLWLLVLRKLI